MKGRKSVQLDDDYCEGDYDDQMMTKQRNSIRNSIRSKRSSIDNEQFDEEETPAH